MISRRALLTGFGALALKPAMVSAAPRPRAAMGAIRWDAWYHGRKGSVAAYVEKALGPAEFQYRMPFFGRPTGANSVIIDGNHDVIMEFEIAVAADAGLNYWAFLAYPPPNAMNNGLELYLANRRRSDIDFCLILEANKWVQFGAKGIERTARLMGEPGYLTLPDGRPVLFVMTSGSGDITKVGVTQTAQWLLKIRAAAGDTGLEDPYIVLMDSHRGAMTLADKLSFDAIGDYAIVPKPDTPGEPFAKLAQRVEAAWEDKYASGLPVVPLAMTGWDTRPRQRHPPPWDKSADNTSYYAEATPAEIAEHVGNCVEWIAKHPASPPLGLIYAWNECDEGYGSLMPTYVAGNPMGNESRVMALGRVLRR